MNENELRDLLSKRLYIELQLFKDSMLCRDKKEIYEASYQIEIYVNLYEILLEDVEHLSGETVRGLLYQNFSILDFLYQEWLTRDDCILDELKQYAGSELEVIVQVNKPVCRREDGNGSGVDKAA